MWNGKYFFFFFAQYICISLYFSFGPINFMTKIRFQSIKGELPAVEGELAQLLVQYVNETND